MIDAPAACGGGATRAVHMRFVTTVYRVGLVLAVASFCGCDGGDTPVSPPRAPSQAAEGNVSFAIPAELATIGTEAGAVPDLELEAGRDLFLNTCSACHGAAGQGMPNQGPDLRNSQVVAHSTDAELLTFVTRGKAPTDPGNKTGLAMPARGGNGALDDRQIGQITRYVRSLQLPPGGPDAGGPKG